MKGSNGLSIEEITEEYYKYLGNIPLKVYSIPATKGQDSIAYNLGKFHFETHFIRKDLCQLIVTNGKTIEEEIPIPYIHSTEIDWQNFFLRTCSLAKKLTDSK